VGAALHKITETVGRAILPTSLDLLNLFRYAAPGQFGNGLQQDYFSIDGGIPYDWSAEFSELKRELREAVKVVLDFVV
jgi:hypothetical protein